MKFSILTALILAHTFAGASQANAAWSWDAIDEASQYEPSLEEIQEGMLDDIISGRSEFHSEPSSSSNARVLIEVFTNPIGLGIRNNTEFALVWVDGQLEDVTVVSTARPGKYSIQGEFPLQIEKRNGKPYPWHRSSIYPKPRGGAPMFFGFRFSGAIWIHATNAYGELGRRASSGCIRTDIPSAMLMWDAVVNRAEGSGRIHVYRKTDLQKSVLASKGIDIGWLNDQIERDLENVRTYLSENAIGGGGTVPMVPHAVPGESLIVPSCAGVDCFDYFGRGAPAKPEALQ